MSLSSHFNAVAGPAPQAPAYPVTLHKVTLDDIQKKEDRGCGLYRIGATITDLDVTTPASVRARFLNNPVFVDIYYRPDSLRDYSTALFTNKILKPIELSEVKFPGTANGRPLGLMGPETLNGVLVEIDMGRICHVGPNIQATGKIIHLHPNWNKSNETVFNATGLQITVETPLKRDQLTAQHFFEKVVVSPPDSSGRLLAKEQRDAALVPGSSTYKDRVWEAVMSIGRNG